MRDLEDEAAGLSRRAFLKCSSGAVLSLVAMNACASAEYIARLANGKSSVSYESWQDIYRKQWRWDTVSWGSHNNQCLPASCTFRVYSRGGLVWREEQAAISHASSAQYPDFNPLGCQKGCGVHSESHDTMLIGTPRAYTWPWTTGNSVTSFSWARRIRPVSGTCESISRRHDPERRVGAHEH